MKNQFSKLNRYELVSIINQLMEENESLRSQLQKSQDEAENKCRIDRDLLKRICAALDNMDDCARTDAAEEEKLHAAR